MDYDCIACCACCRSPRRVKPTPEDVEHIRDYWEEKGLKITSFVDDHGWIVHRDYRCLFLLSDGHCAVYEVRPEACMMFDVGGEACEAARRSNGIA